MYAFLAALAILVVLILARWLLARAAILTLEDAIVAPGEEGEIRLWLERRLFLFIDPDIEGEEVELLSDAGSHGKAVTDLDGIARWKIGPLPPGLHRFRARLPEESRYHAVEAEGIVASIPPDEASIITDIDHTVADCSPFGFISRPNDSVRPLPGAPEALREIAKSCRIVYLSARDHIFVAKTRHWLRSNGFPEGPLFLRRMRFTSASPLVHKIARLEEIVARLRNIRWGVGDMPTDVEAYRRRGIPPILLSDKPLSTVPDDVPRVASWAEILATFSSSRSSGSSPPR